MQDGGEEVGIVSDAKAMRAGRSKAGGASCVRVFVIGTEDEIRRP